MKTFTIAVIAGDGVGPEVIPQGKRVQRVSADLQLPRAPARRQATRSMLK